MINDATLDRRTCERKLAYRDPRFAARVARKALADDPALDALFVYQCVACFKFHLSKKARGSGECRREVRRA